MKGLTLDLEFKLSNSMIIKQMVNNHNMKKNNRPGTVLAD